jgi:hypothetical protein
MLRDVEGWVLAGFRRHPADEFLLARLFSKNDTCALKPNVGVACITDEAGDADNRYEIPDTPPQVAIRVFVLAHAEKLDPMCIGVRLLGVPLGTCRLAARRRTISWLRRGAVGLLHRRLLQLVIVLILRRLDRCGLRLEGTPAGRGLLLLHHVRAPLGIGERNWHSHNNCIVVVSRLDLGLRL